LANFFLPPNVNQRPLLSQSFWVSSSVVPHAFHGDGHRPSMIKDPLLQLAHSRSGKAQATASHSQSSTRSSPSPTL
jgi:hypothetical protein